MVRFLIPEGEGQHPLTTTQPGVVTIAEDLFASPWRATVAAGGLTGFLSLLGRARPGTFLKSAALLGVLDLSVTGANIYGRQELNRAVLKLDGVNATPGKLVARSSGLMTVEDMVLNGGIGGIFVALRPHLIPGACGLPRFLGATVVGMAVGYKVGQILPPWVPEQQKSMSVRHHLAIRNREYRRLLQDPDTMASLSRVAVLTLKRETISQTTFDEHSDGALPSTLPLGQSAMRTGGNASPKSSSLTEEPSLVRGSSSRQASMPRDFFTTQDAPRLTALLKKLRDTCCTIDAELQYIYASLSQARQEYAVQGENSKEKEILVEMIYLLNAQAEKALGKSATFRLHAVDLERRLNNLASDALLDLEGDASRWTPFPTTEMLLMPYPTPENIKMDPTHAPLATVKALRALYHEIRNAVSRVSPKLEAADPRPSNYEGSLGPQAYRERLAAFRNEKVKQQEAIGRCLRWFEERVKEAEQRKAETAVL